MAVGVDWRNARVSRLAFITGCLIPIISIPSFAEDRVRFNEQIRPIFAEHCLHCHGPDAKNRKADLRLDLEKIAKKSAIVPGKPQDSELYRRLISDDRDTKMPPADSGKKLTKAQIELLRRWIAEGAKYEGHWAFEPIRNPAPPKVGGKSATDIDRFLIAALEKRGLKMSPAVSRQQLIRRATIDLTGLPPTWEEVTSFVNDKSPNAFERVIDRLLQSPRYGERWGRHWLDIARYADTHGGAAIGFTRFPFSYTYRDYVIRAFNADLPYDKFITQQLAADQLGLPDNDPALAGLGFLTVGMQYRNQHDVIDDQIDVVSRGLLGLTVACARCHDHKYDPIPTRDYYSLYATFAGSKSPDLLPLIGKPADTQAYRDYRAELTRRTISRDDMAREQSAVMRSRLKMQVGLYLRELAKGTPEQDLSAAFLSFRTDDLRPSVIERWRRHLAKIPATDAVFGPWQQLSKLDKKDFAVNALKLIDLLQKQNGDPKKFAAQQRLSAAAPRWNPRALEAIAKKKPQSMLDVADAYGDLFGTVHQEWLRGLLAASLEAKPGSKPVPDEDAQHADINSPINRQLRRHLYKPDTPTEMAEEEATTLLNRPVRDNLSGREGAIHNLHLSSAGSPPRAMVLREDDNPQEFRIFKRGSPIDRGDVVNARFLTTLGGGDENPFADGQRRLGLAKAIIDPGNPLTRRVIVNFVWQHHFGQGLVRTPDDFGTRGQPPTHPELLDHLATVFLKDGWSLKKLHKRIMLTAAYQQAAREDVASRVKDSENELLWRMPRRKLDLESMRDSMLAVSGELSPAMGGRPFELQAKPAVPRRSVYAFINRDIISSFASTFDAANPNTCTAKRPKTTVPQQALFALNSDFIQDRAAAVTKLKDVTSAPSDEERVRMLYRRVLSRSPKPQELRIAVAYVQSQPKNGKVNPWQQLAHVLLATNEFVFVD